MVKIRIPEGRVGGPLQEKLGQHPNGRDLKQTIHGRFRVFTVSHVFVRGFPGRLNDIHDLLTESFLNVRVFDEHIHGEGEKGRGSIPSCHEKVNELRFCQIIQAFFFLLASSLRMVYSIIALVFRGGYEAGVR